MPAFVALGKRLSKNLAAADVKGQYPPDNCDCICSALTIAFFVWIFLSTTAL